MSTALPVIVNDLHADQFIWVASAYGIAGTVLLPLIGGLAQVRSMNIYTHRLLGSYPPTAHRQVFGRGPVMMGSLVFLMAGAAISGAAQSMNMLLIGRGESSWDT